MYDYQKNWTEPFPAEKNSGASWKPESMQPEYTITDRERLIQRIDNIVKELRNQNDLSPELKKRYIKLLEVIEEEVDDYRHNIKLDYALSFICMLIYGAIYFLRNDPNVAVIKDEAAIAAILGTVGFVGKSIYDSDKAKEFYNQQIKPKIDEAKTIIHSPTNQ